MTALPPALGRYRLLDGSPIEGARRVHPAEDPFLGREVLLKVLHRPSESADRVERFREEMRIHASASHAGLVGLLDAGEDGDWLWFALERLAGRSLRAELIERGRLPVARGLRILVGILRPLAALHARNVVHRDVKPENVFLVPDDLEPDGRPVLLDLGIAKDRSEAGRTITREGAGALGSEHYAAPEVHADASRATFASDVYSTGVLLYESLAGRLPLGENRPRIDEVAADAPPWVHEVYARMTASDERDRYAGAADVLDALRLEIAPADWFRLAQPDQTPHSPPRALSPPPTERPRRPSFATRVYRILSR